MSIDFYNQNADQFFQDTANLDVSILYQPFLSRLPPRAHILDLGCGSGRDTKAFLDLGFRVTAIDASQEMAIRANQLTGQQVQVQEFNHINEPSTYDGVWACASLLHVNLIELPLIMAKIRDSLKSGGILYVSFKYGNRERTANGRYFTDLNQQRLQELVDLVPAFQVAKIWMTDDLRPGRDQKWLNSILYKDS